MRSFSKNSFGFNKISPGVFIGVLIVIVFLIINPFKSGLSAISNVPGWSDRGTPKNKDTWNTNPKYNSADDCAKYAISQGNPGYTWRNISHKKNEGKNTCVTLKSVEPQNLNSPMKDTGSHTTGCSIQNKQWPNCGFSENDKTTLRTIKELERTIGIKKSSYDYAVTLFQNATDYWEKLQRAYDYDRTWGDYVTAIDNYNTAVEQLYSGNREMTRGLL